MGLAADADAPEEPVVELATEHLSQATMLPFVMYVDADGGWLAGHAGAVSPDRLREQLLDLVEE